MCKKLGPVQKHLSSGIPGNSDQRLCLFLLFLFSLPSKPTWAALLRFAHLAEGSCMWLWFTLSSCMCVEGCSRLKVIIVAVSENSPSRCRASLSLEALRTFCETAGSLPHAHSLLNKHRHTSRKTHFPAILLQVHTVLSNCLTHRHAG